jgi:hypothetical protein
VESSDDGFMLCCQRLENNQKAATNVKSLISKVAGIANMYSGRLDIIAYLNLTDMGRANRSSPETAGISGFPTEESNHMLQIGREVI